MIKKATLRIEGTDVQIIRDEKFFGCVCLPNCSTFETISYYFEDLGYDEDRKFSIVFVPGLDSYLFRDSASREYLKFDELLNDGLRKEFEYCQKALMNKFKAKIDDRVYKSYYMNKNILKDDKKWLPEN